MLLRVTPGIKPSTHSYIQTGQADSKFGVRARRRAARGGGVPREAGLELRGLHAHIGSQVFELEAFERLRGGAARIGDWPLLNLGGGLGIAYTADDEPPSIEEYVEALLRRAPDGVTVLCEPGRSLVGNAGVTLYTVGTVKRIPGVRTYVAVDGGMSDNLRPMLYGARYEAEIADRFGGDELCTVAGMHCESGDILVRDVRLERPAPGRRAGGARHGRLRSRDGEQLQRRAAAAGGLLQGRRRARGRAPRDLRRPDPAVTL